MQGRRPAKITLAIAATGLALVATPVLANYVVRKSFDRQVVGADAVLIVQGRGDREDCSTSAGQLGGSGICTTLRVLNVLKGSARADIALEIEGMIPERALDCCDAGKIYAMALDGRPGGVYRSTNASWSVYELPGPWSTARAGEPGARPVERRPRSFDQIVVSADVFAIVVGTGEQRSCGNGYVGQECSVVTVIKAMKGEVPPTLMVPLAQRMLDIDRGVARDEPFGCCDEDQIYVLATYEGRDGVFTPVNGGVGSVVRLGAAGGDLSAGGR
jgi:hypothetical protein